MYNKSLLCPRHPPHRLHCHFELEHFVLSILLYLKMLRQDLLSGQMGKTPVECDPFLRKVRNPKHDETWETRLETIACEKAAEIYVQMRTSSEREPPPELHLSGVGGSQ